MAQMVKRGDVIRGIVVKREPGKKPVIEIGIHRFYIQPREGDSKYTALYEPIKRGDSVDVRVGSIWYKGRFPNCDVYLITDNEGNCECSDFGREIKPGIQKNDAWEPQARLSRTMKFANYEDWYQKTFGNVLVPEEVLERLERESGFAGINGCF